MKQPDHRHTIDLNSDLGEFEDEPRKILAERVLGQVTSANIACGFHAGSPDLMRWTIACAKRLGVNIGAHPGFDDPEHFGRRVLTTSPTDIENLVAYQVGAVAALAAMEGVPLRHVKPHGALYSLTARNHHVARAFTRSIAAVDRTLLVVGLAGSTLIEAGRDAGLTVKEEAFADRAYHPDRSLVTRDQPGAVIHDVSAVVTRALALVKESVVRGINGEPIAIKADTICIHGDTPGADRLARAVRQGLLQANVVVTPMTHTHE